MGACGSKKPYETAYDEMEIGQRTIHNVLKRSMKIIEEQGEKCPESELPYLMQYVQFFLVVLHSHHEHEDHLIFPFVDKKFPGMMQKQVDEHKILQDLMGQLGKVSETKTPNREDAQKAGSLSRQIYDFLVPHLDDEERMLDKKFYTTNYTEPEVQKIMNIILKEVQKGNPTKELVFFISHCDATEKLANGHGFPWFVKSVLYPKWANTYPKVWQFAPFPNKKANGRLIW